MTMITIVMKACTAFSDVRKVSIIVLQLTGRSLAQPALRFPLRFIECCSQYAEHERIRTGAELLTVGAVRV
jgi:hypothetical protein